MRSKSRTELGMRRANIDRGSERRDLRRCRRVRRGNAQVLYPWDRSQARTALQGSSVRLSNLVGLWPFLAPLAAAWRGSEYNRRRGFGGGWMCCVGDLYGSSHTQPRRCWSLGLHLARSLCHVIFLMRPVRYPRGRAPISRSLIRTHQKREFLRARRDVAGFRYLLPSVPMQVPVHHEV